MTASQLRLFFPTLSHGQVFQLVVIFLTLLLTPFSQHPSIVKQTVAVELYSHPDSTPLLRSSVAFSNPAQYRLSADQELANTLGALVSAQALYIEDLRSGSVLLEKRSDQVLSPASTTKLMTALVALDRYSPDQVLTVKNAATVSGARAGLFFGETLTVQSLLELALIASANDAAMTLAENYPGGVTAFVEAMNQKATQAGLARTHFTNPVGFDSPEHVSTAQDLALLAKQAVAHPLIAATVSKTQATIYDSTGRFTHQVVSTNELLTKDQTVKGIKTGTTEQAGQVLITLVERSGHPILIVLLNSTDRFIETAQIISWVYESYEWLELENLRKTLKMDSLAIERTEGGCYTRKVKGCER